MIFPYFPNIAHGFPIVPIVCHSFPIFPIKPSISFGDFLIDQHRADTAARRIREDTADGAPSGVALVVSEVIVDPQSSLRLFHVVSILYVVWVDWPT